METQRNAEQGYTYWELMIVIAIIAILTALLLPNFSQLIGRSKELKTMNDCKRVGEAMAHWDLDNKGVPSSTFTGTPPAITVSNFSPISTSALSTLLVPNYIYNVPILDEWKNPYLYYLKDFSPTSPNTLMCISLGRDGATQSTPLPSYTINTFPTSDFDQDIVWADGSFIRNPA
jgi:prepilin-type N-terminal cleavage/methylation domain-containing protein